MNFFITSIDFSPYFLHNQDPELIFFRLREQRFSLHINRYKIINNNLFDCSIDSHLQFINTYWVILLLFKYSINSIILLSKSSECREKITFLNRTSNNIWWLYHTIKQFWILNNLRNAFPLIIIPISSNLPRLAAEGGNYGSVNLSVFLQYIL